MIKPGSAAKDLLRLALSARRGAALAAAALAAAALAAAALLIAAMLLGLFFSTASAQSGPPALAEFWQRVEYTRTWLKSGPVPQYWAAEAGALAEGWSAVREVRLPDGSLAPVDTSDLVALLKADPPDRDRLDAYLAALLQARERWSPSGDGNRELGALQRVLARPEFQGQAENPLSRLLRRALDFLWNVFQKLFPNSEAAVPVPSWLVIALSAALLGGILAYIFRDIWRNVLHEAELAETDPADGEILTSAQASLRAQQLSGSGDYRQAVRYLYLSALLLLDERGLLRYNRSLTNREYLRQVSGRPGLSGLLRPVIDTFDRVWYGFQSIDQASYTRYTEQVSALEETKEA